MIEVLLRLRVLQVLLDSFLAAEASMENGIFILKFFTKIYPGYV